MKHKHASIALVAIAVLLMAGFSCNSKTAAVASRDVAASVKAFQTAEISLHKQGKVSDAEHINLQRYLIAVGTAGKAVDQCIRIGRGAGCVDIGLSASTDLLNQGVLPIQDAQTKQQLQVAGQLIVAAFNNLGLAVR